MCRRAYSLSLCIAVFVTATLSLHARGEVPPLPPEFDGGNIGDWLGSGPIFGFRHPWGLDLPGDGHGSFDPGDNGYGWGGGNGNSGGGNFDPGPNSCSCGPVNICNRVNLAKCQAEHKNFCEAWCSCDVRVLRSRPPVGTILPGTCALRAYPKIGPNGCSAPGGGCSVRYGQTAKW